MSVTSIDTKIAPFRAMSLASEANTITPATSQTREGNEP